MSKSKYVEDPSQTRKYNASIAIMLGDRVATFLQQVAYHTTWKEEKYGAGEWRSSLSEWHDTFPWWSVDTIKRIIKECRDIGVLKIRKNTFHGRDAIWFSLDYEKLNEIGDEGAKRYDQHLRRRDLVQNAPPESDDLVQNALGASAKASMNLVQNAPHLLYPSTTTSNTSNKSDAGASTVSATKSLQSVEELQQSIKSKNLSAFRAKFEEKFSLLSFLKIWQILVTSEHGSKAYVPLSPKDKKMARSFITWCKECGESAPDFLQWCISNWSSLRYSSLKWAKLGDIPHLPTILNLRDRFLEQYRATSGSESTPTKTSTVYTSVDQIPKDHPDFITLKKMVEITGRVELR